MVTGLRLIRIAGLIAVAIAALVTAGGQAFASPSCSISATNGNSTVTISNSGASGEVYFGTVDASYDVSSGDTSDTVNVPTEATPSVSSITNESPLTVGYGSNYGPTSGGNFVAIGGSNLSPTVDVTVGGTDCGSFTYSGSVSVSIGGTAAPSVGVVSSTEIIATAPAGIVGVANVLVVMPTSINSGTSGGGLYTYVQGTPSISTVGPDYGLTTGGNQVTIEGSNFVPGTYPNGNSATTVTFYCGSTANTITNATVASTSVTVPSVPACNTPGAYEVSVSTVGGTATSSYQYIAPVTPIVTSVSPASGTTAGGTQVTISGSNFTGATSVTIGGVAVNSFNVTGPGTITTTTPVSANGAGAAAVSVTVPQASPQTGTGTGLFTYTVPAPVVTAITPTSGSTGGGTAVTIRGQYFTNGAPTPTSIVSAGGVTIGGTALTNIQVVSDTEITGTTGAHAAGAGLPVVVTTSCTPGCGGGMTTSTTAFYTYGTPAPTVTAVSPSGGTTAGGTNVTISGQYFTGETMVTFGGAAATNVSFVNDGEITATTPTHAAGIVNVAVTTSVGTGTGVDLYTYGASPPTVSTISPTSGTTLGGTAVTITGTNFTGTPQVTIGGNAAAEVTVVNSTTLTAVTPAGTGSSVPVIVTTSFGTSAAADKYSYVVPTPPTEPAPTVISINPTSGTTLGLTPVTITGTNFTGATAVMFGANAATNVTVVNATTITALTPPGTGVVNVVVTTPGGTGTGTGLYTYVTVAPTVTAVTPSTGTTLGGTSVTITGTNFTGATAVTFGGTPATGVTVVTATTITATTPAGTGVVSVAVTTGAGTGTGTNLFTYVAQLLPIVTAITPNGGSIANGGNTAGGASVTITGSNFTGATSVTIGGNAVTFMTVVSATTITAITPAHAPGVVNVVVTTPAGISGTSGTGLFTYVEGPPTVTAITPTSGPTAGGTPVTITGTNFTGATSVEIGGNTPTSVTFVSSTSITATTTAHAAGLVNVAVTTPAGTGVGTNLFTYLGVVPVVTSISPTSGPPGGGTVVTITGTGFTGATAVNFGSTSVTSGFTVNGAGTSITVNSPPGSGTVNVTVTTLGGPSAPGQFSYTSKASTTLTLTSSPNPSAYGQPVTFTAKVTGNSPTGTVIFSEGSKQIATVTLSNITATSSTATFAISSLPIGSDAITASYGGDANNAPDPETLIQTVNVPSDSVKLREMQLAVMPIVANLSGQAITGAIDTAIGAGFSGSCPTAPTSNGSGFTYCFDGDSNAQTQTSAASVAPEPAAALNLSQPGAALDITQPGAAPDQAQHAAAFDQTSLAYPNGSGNRVGDDFTALGYDGPPAQPAQPAQAAQPVALAASAPLPTKALPPPPREWLAWIDVRGADFDRNSVGSDLKGTQVNALSGLTRRFSEDFLVGVIGGYEHFDYSSQAYNGVLRGDGFTGGAYLGWRLTTSLRFEAGGTWSDILASDTSGAASGSFTGTRWLGFGGLTGTYNWLGFALEPSAQVFTLWEHENAYTDTLGTLQANHEFDTGRASGGFKASYPFAMSTWILAPYAGIYGDYYFTMDNATTVGLTTVPLLQGWAARATGGVTATFGGGAQLTAGTELSGLGNDTHILTWRVRGSVPF